MSNIIINFKDQFLLFGQCREFMVLHLNASIRIEIPYCPVQQENFLVL